MEEIKGNEIDLEVDDTVEYDDDFVADESLTEAIDNKELMKGQMELTPVEDKAREVQDPVYADASREMEKTRKVKEKTLAVEKEPKHEENPKTPDMNPGAKEMKLEEAVNEFSETTLTDIDDDFEEEEKVEEVEEACEAFEMMDKEKEVNFEYNDEDAWIAEEAEEEKDFDRDDDFEEYEDEKLFDFDDDFDEVEESVGHRVETGFIGVPDVEDAQSIVDQAIELFGRVPGGLYDDLDAAGFYVDADNKVHKKIEEDFGDEEIGEKEKVAEPKCEEVKKETATIKTPRGTITLSEKTEDELKGEGYGYWFTARVDDKEYRVLNNGTEALAVEVKAELEEEVDVTKWASNILEFPSGDYLYVDYDDGKLIAGGATNAGIIHDFELDYDETKSEDKNIQALYDKIIEERPEYLGEEVESLEEALDKKTDSQLNEELINDEFDEFMKLAKKLGIETLADLQRVMNEPEARFNGTELERLQAYAKEANPRGLNLRNDEELKKKNNRIEEEYELNDKEIIDKFEDDGDIHQIVKAPNGRYFNEYSLQATNHYGVFAPSSIAGPYETEEEAREFMAKHRPKAKKVEKESVAVNEELTDEEKHEEEVEEGEGIVALQNAIKNEKAHGRDPMECYPIAKAFEDEKKEKIEESLSNKNVEEEIRKGIREYFDNWDDDEYRDFIEDYLVVEVKPFKSYEGDTGTKVEVRTELSYNTLDDIIDEKLDSIIKKYDEEAYFDHDDGGIISAVIWDR